MKLTNFNPKFLMNKFNQYHQDKLYQQILVSKNITKQEIDRFSLNLEEKVINNLKNIKPFLGDLKNQLNLGLSWNEEILYSGFDSSRYRI